MQTQAREVVERYYTAFDGHTDEWKDLVTDDVVFDGPVQHARGKAEFVGLTGQFLQVNHRQITSLYQPLQVRFALEEM